MSTPLSGDGLFDLPADVRHEPLARVVLIAGASGTGKSRLAKRSRLPMIGLDNFYYDVDRPGLPTKHGRVDWDDVATWDRRGALLALVELCTTGAVTVPVYDIPTSRKVGEERVELDGSKIVVAEGIFATSLVDDLKAEGLLADALALHQPRLRTAWFRLMRDLDEQRKSTPELLARGLRHMAAEPELNRRLQREGARLISPEDAAQYIAELARKTG